MNGADDTQAAPRRMMQFRKSNLPRMETASARRQGTIARAALESLGREDAMAFLNTEHTELGGRPLDLATRSAHGHDRVLAVLDGIVTQRRTASA